MINLLNYLNISMVPHPAIKRSFFIKFLLATAFAGNLYMLLQAFFHLLNIHALDVWLRWYSFTVPPIYNLGILVGTAMVLYALFKIYKEGIVAFKLYFIGKMAMYMAYLTLIWLEYRLSQLPFPYIIIPVLLFTQLIYPMLLYLSLRKSKA